ncbi:MAG: cellulase family glycosylhydrolase [Ignavibacteria bacterium]
MNKTFIKADNGQFKADDKIFKFIGCNMYELAFVDPLTTRNMIKDAFDEGFTVIRFWAYEPVDKDKILEICNVAGEFDIRIIPVFADSWGGFQTNKIEGGFYREGYKGSYLNHVNSITESLKHRCEILLWELINEPATDSFNDIYNFSKHVSEEIKKTDPNHLISIGTIGGVGDKFGGSLSRLNSSNFKKLYSIKTLDALSIHDYSFSSNVLERFDIYRRTEGRIKSANFYNRLNKIFNSFLDRIDLHTIGKYNKTFDFPLTIRTVWRAFNKKNIAVAKELNKPIYVGEVGFKKNMKETRKKILELELKNYFDDGISGVLLWSFEAQGRSLDGHDYGFNIEDGFEEVIKKF